MLFETKYLAYTAICLAGGYWCVIQAMQRLCLLLCQYLPGYLRCHCYCCCYRYFYCYYQCYCYCQCYRICYCYCFSFCHCSCYCHCCCFCMRYWSAETETFVSFFVNAGREALDGTDIKEQSIFECFVSVDALGEAGASQVHFTQMSTSDVFIQTTSISQCIREDWPRTGFTMLHKFCTICSIFGFHQKCVEFPC